MLRKSKSIVSTTKIYLAANPAATSLIFSASTLLLFNQTQFKPLILAILISPIGKYGAPRQLFILFSRNLIALTGILWTFHSIFGLFRIESLQSNNLSILIQVAAIQIIKKWDPKELPLRYRQNFSRGKAQSILLFTLLLTYLFTFLSFPERLSTFLLGWDHLNGHLWLTAQIYEEGYIRTNAEDFVGIYPKAEFPLILSFSNAVVDFQSLVQGIVFVEILLVLAAIFILHDLTFGPPTVGKNDNFVKVLATISATPILIFFIFYGWTSLILTTSALLVLTWQARKRGKDSNFQILFFVALAGIQSWTLIAPIVSIILFSRKSEIKRKGFKFFAFLFIIVNTPSIFAIFHFNGLEQVAEGFRSNSTWFFALVLGTVLPILYLLRSKTIHLVFKLLIFSTYIEVILIWLSTSPGKELPYYAIKIFLLTVLFMVPYLVNLALGFISIERLKILVASLLILGMFTIGNVPASNYSYLNFMFGKNLETNWLAENTARYLQTKSDKRIILVSNYVIDLKVVFNLAETKKQELFAYDLKYICEPGVVKEGDLILIDPMTNVPKCGQD